VYPVEKTPIGEHLSISEAEAQYVADRYGAASLAVLHTRTVRRDNVYNKFVALVIETENVRCQTLTIVKREDGDRANVDFA
jgi:hypothetical protein